MKFTTTISTRGKKNRKKKTKKDDETFQRPGKGIATQKKKPWREIRQSQQSQRSTLHVGRLGNLDRQYKDQQRRIMQQRRKRKVSKEKSQRLKKEKTFKGLERKNRRRKAGYDLWGVRKKKGEKTVRHEDPQNKDS